MCLYCYYLSYICVLEFVQAYYKLLLLLFLLSLSLLKDIMYCTYRESLDPIRRCCATVLIWPCTYTPGRRKCIDRSPVLSSSSTKTFLRPYSPCAIQHIPAPSIQYPVLLLLFTCFYSGSCSCSCWGSVLQCALTVEFQTKLYAGNMR